MPKLLIIESDSKGFAEALPRYVPPGSWAKIRAFRNWLIWQSALGTRSPKTTNKRIAGFVNEAALAHRRSDQRTEPRGNEVRIGEAVEQGRHSRFGRSDAEGDSV